MAGSARRERKPVAVASSAGLLLATLSTLACSGDRVPRYELEPFGSDRPPPTSLVGHLVVTNFGEDSLSIVDPSTRKMLWRLPVGLVPVELEGPHHVAVDPRGTHLYVNLSQAVPGSGSGPHGAHGTGSIPGNVLKIDARTGSVVGDVTVDRNPGDNLLSPDGKTLYVTHYDLVAWQPAARAGDFRKGDSRLAIVDADSMTVKRFVPLCPTAHGMTLSSDGRTLFATCGTDGIAVLDVSNPAAEAQRVLLPSATERASCSFCPYALGTAPDGRIWVAGLGPNGGVRDGGVRIYDPNASAFDVAARVQFCGGALFPAFVRDESGDGFTAYVPEQGACGDSLRVVRQADRSSPPKLVDNIDLPPEVCVNAHSARLNDERTVIVVCEGNHRSPGTLVWVDIVTKTVVDHTKVGVFPDDVELVPMPAPGSPSQQQTFRSRVPQ